MRLLLAGGLATLALAASACGAYSFPSSSRSGVGTVAGQVVAVPCAPVESAQNPCAGRPSPNMEIDFTSAGGGTVVTKTDTDGMYSVSLDAGTWTVRLKAVRLIKGPAAVTVTSGATVTADYVVDSGIRVPVPLPAPAAA